jgi:tRNA(fMet)-specific endonuclease VapC
MLNVIVSETTVPVRYVLDTDTVTHQQLGHPLVVAKLRLVDRSTVATTVITMYEQLRGRLAAINRKQSDAQLQLAFRHLQATQQYYCTARILPFVEKATQIHQTLVTQKVRIGSQDLQIAAIVLAHHAVLVTANQRHFAQVPDLQIEDWTRK